MAGPYFNYWVKNLDPDSFLGLGQDAMGLSAWQAWMCPKTSLGVRRVCSKGAKLS